MKKLYFLLLAVSFGVVVNAQSYDVSVDLINYTPNEPTSDDPLVLDFSVTNVGIDIPMGDSIFYALTADGTIFWETDDLTEGYMLFTKLTAPFLTGDSFNVSVTNVSMAWMYDHIGVNSNICGIVMGVNMQTATPPTMLDITNDFSCVNYTVTAFAGLEGVGTDYLSVYPNPASDAVNFQIGNNEVSQINIFDLTGKLVQSVNVSGSIETISTENMGSGVFYYQMMNGEDMIATDKFVVTK